jgi:hypothetical protein
LSLGTWTLYPFSHELDKMRAKQINPSQGNNQMISSPILINENAGSIKSHDAFSSHAALLNHAIHSYHAIARD